METLFFGTRNDKCLGISSSERILSIIKSNPISQSTRYRIEGWKGPSTKFLYRELSGWSPIRIIGMPSLLKSLTATFNESIGTTTPTITIKENDYPITIRFGSGGSALSFLVQHGGMEPLTRNTAGLVSYTFKSVSSGVTYTLNSLVYTGQSWVRFNISPNFNEGSGNKDVIFIGR